MTKKGSRNGAPSELENLFREVVKKNFVTGTEEAFEIAIRGGNQYGSDMAKAHRGKVDQ